MSLSSTDQIDQLERLIVQLNGLKEEVALLSKKSPTDGLNKFKLSLVNQVLEAANQFLQGTYKPFDSFEVFNVDDAPSNSDVVMIITQYLEQLERYRSDNVVHTGMGEYAYVVGGKASKRQARSPTRVIIKK